MPDPDANLIENHRRLAAAAGLPLDRVTVRQVHGAAVHVVGDPARSPADADAIVSSDSSSSVVIRVADCAALLLASADGRTIAAVHAGWRGVVAGVISETIRVMVHRGAPPVFASIFPCISMDAFEVGGEVVTAFEEALGPGAPVKRVAGGKGRVGIADSCVLQLRRGGVGNVEVFAECTHRLGDEFFSHRRATTTSDGIAGADGPRCRAARGAT